MPLTSFLDHLPPADRELALRIFGCFAEAEHMLKAAGYLKRGRENAEADWDAYGRAIAGRFKNLRDPALRKALALLADSPPRRQVVRDGHLAWKDVVRPNGHGDEEYGLLLVRRVRNNLFHGAKYMLGGEAGYSRDQDLISAALTVLQHSLTPMPRKVPASSHNAA